MDGSESILRGVLAFCKYYTLHWRCILVWMHTMTLLVLLAQQIYLLRIKNLPCLLLNYLEMRIHTRTNEWLPATFSNSHGPFEVRLQATSSCSLG